MMSMLSAIYKSITGLMSFTKGLDSVSANVSNVNTPGFKGKDIFFRDLASPQDDGGVGTFGSSIRFAQGDITKTSNNTDLAIDGNGFFILRDPDNYSITYSRSGQFRIDDDGYLVDSVSGGRVAALTTGTGLQDIKIDDSVVDAPQVTSKVSLKGNLNSSASVGSTYPANPTTEPFEVEVFDTQGQVQKLRLVFTKQAGNSWTVQVSTSTGVNVGTPQTITFDGSGAPTSGFNAFTVTYTPTSSPGFPITFNFGEAGTFGGVTGFSAASSTIEILESDGRALGRISSFEFNEDGFLVLAFSNGETKQTQRLALASFDNMNALYSVGDTLFKVKSNTTINIGHPGEGTFGTIKPSSLELSNVELSKEFADLVIIQRGYQASSQVINVTKEMLDQLYNSTRSGS